ncbi:MAG: ribosome-associated heat shock protein Hsp15 [Parasphingorhabdus sp.]|jgi:ribosome-associated heat shock protein Hsp15
MVDRPDKKPETSSHAVEVRLDRWLMAARFYKTRQLSAAALKSGHIELNGRKAKPAKSVQKGDILDIRKHPFRLELTVLEIREKRVGAELASQMYEETAASVKKRQVILDQQAVERQSVRFESGRPSKKDRRSISRFKRQSI